MPGIPVLKPCEIVAILLAPGFSEASVTQWDGLLPPDGVDAAVIAARIGDALAGKHPVPAAIAHQVACAGVPRRACVQAPEAVSLFYAQQLKEYQGVISMPRLGRRSRRAQRLPG